MTANREGQKVPQVTFRTRSGNDWKNVASDEIFKGKTVVLFSLPGAFTPTCSSTHLPRYNELAPAFFANGVDAIVCVSVNDAFVMNEWAANQECANVTMLPDGNGEFTEGMGMLVGQIRPGLRQALVALLDAGEGRRGREDVHRAAEARRPVRSVRCRHHARLRRPESQEARPGRDPDARGLRLLRAGQAAAQGAGLRLRRTVPGPQERSRIVGAISGAGTVPQVFVNGQRIGGLEELQKWAQKAA